MSPELSRGQASEGKHGPIRGKMENREPITDHQSKVVMLAAERQDRIDLTETITQFSDSAIIPDRASVIERKATYYGPELLLHSKINGKDRNYLLNAPGPDSHLLLWAADTDDENFRHSWFAAAEVKAELSEDQISYEICPECSKPLKSIEHERKSALGLCGE